MTFRRLPPMPPGGYDLDDTAMVEAKPKTPKTPKKKNQEFVQGDGGDAEMHAVLLGKDDQFTTSIKAVPAKR